MRFAFTVLLVVFAFGLQAAIGSTTPHLKRSALESSHVSSFHGVTGEGEHAEDMTEDMTPVPLCCDVLVEGHTADGFAKDCPAFCLVLSNAQGVSAQALKPVLEPTFVSVARPANPRPVDPPPIST